MDNPTWIYRANGEARIIDLAPGEALPEGWFPSPSVITDPALATGEALSARAAGRAYVPPVAVDADAPEPGEPAGEALAAALARIAQLEAVIVTGTRENQMLAADVNALDASAEAAVALAEHLKGDLDKAVADIATLTEHLQKAQADGGFAADELTAAKASIEALTADLAQARADLDAATAPKAETKPAKAGK